MYLKFRAHIENIQPTELLEFITFLEQKCEKLIVYLHPKQSRNGFKEPEREHIHGLCIGPTFTEKTMRDWLSARLKLEKSNKSYSVGSTYTRDKKAIKITELSYPTYITYMSKGVFDPLHVKGFTPEEIADFKGAWRSPATATTHVRIETISPAKKKTQFEVGHEAEVRYLEIPGYDERDEVDWKMMTRLVIDVLHENKIVAHEFTVIHIVQDIQSRLDSERYINRIFSKIRL